MSETRKLTPERRAAGRALCETTLEGAWEIDSHTVRSRMLPDALDDLDRADQEIAALREALSECLPVLGGLLLRGDESPAVVEETNRRMVLVTATLAMSSPVAEARTRAVSAARELLEAIYPASVFVGGPCCAQPACDHDEGVRLVRRLRDALDAEELLAQSRRDP